MSNHSNHNYPRLHNAMWPGLVGKGSPGAEPFIDLNAMLELERLTGISGFPALSSGLCLPPAFRPAGIRFLGHLVPPGNLPPLPLAY